MFIVSD